ncbi:hypothetical protein BJX63DRAFT_424064 [Aspergillus granulosus]|uniref:Luciferase domain-containing protein n=1 Tax=Aspergillus granulosus TaxID=176169 RepID=A0ABR4H160_9EURO
MFFCIRTRLCYILAALPIAVFALSGGPPYNVLGWLAVKFVFNPFKRENEKTEYLTKLPKRQGEQPQMGTFAVPQRQRDRCRPRRRKKCKLMAEHDLFFTRNAQIANRPPSMLEKYTDAAHVCIGVLLTAVAAQMKRKICHAHGTSDHSIHVTLSLIDCKRAIESGWGQRFSLAGTKLFKDLTLGHLPAIPLEYILVYAPRNEEEIQVVMQIVKASGYCVQVRYPLGRLK